MIIKLVNVYHVYLDIDLLMISVNWLNVNNQTVNNVNNQKYVINALKDMLLIKSVFAMFANLIARYVLKDMN